MLYKVEIGIIEKDKYILIDIGTSSVKSYKLEYNILQNLGRKHLYLKDGNSDKYGLAVEKLEELVHMIVDLKIRYPKHCIMAFGTSVFRTLDEEKKNNTIKYIFDATGVKLNVISTFQEGTYLAKGVICEFKKQEDVLIVNIGGGSTEQILLKDNEFIQEVHLEFGSESVVNKFLKFYKREEFATYEDIKKYITQNMEYVSQKSKYVVITGGITNLIKTVDYNFDKDDIFQTTDDLVKINLVELKLCNRNFLNRVINNDLSELFIENPKLAYGSLSACIILECLGEYVDVESIIFSDKNLIDGIIIELKNKSK